MEFWSRIHPDLRSLEVPEAFQRGMVRTARQALDALRHQLEIIHQQTEISPGITVIPAPGHTPGHMAVEVASGEDRLLHIGDAAFHPIHLEEPEWPCVLDLDRAAATRTRRALLERAVTQQARVMAFHFPFPSIGTVVGRDCGGWHWAPGWARPA
jgi:glyoxylase-like metal-dependent hydrolase (beta-lactamase superfamily II)